MPHYKNRTSRLIVYLNTFTGVFLFACKHCMDGIHRFEDNSLSFIQFKLWDENKNTMHINEQRIIISQIECRTFAYWISILRLPRKSVVCTVFVWFDFQNWINLILFLRNWSNISNCFWCFAFNERLWFKTERWNNCLRWNLCRGSMKDQLA